MHGQVANDDKPVQDLRSLSGGERSFVTICFLLALGKKLVVSCLFPLCPPCLAKHIYSLSPMQST